MNSIASSLSHRALLPSPNEQQVDGALLELQKFAVDREKTADSGLIGIDPDDVMKCCRTVGSFVEATGGLGERRILILLEILKDPSKDVARIGVCEVFESLVNKGVQLPRDILFSLAIIASNEDDIVGSMSSKGVLNLLVSKGKLSQKGLDELLSKAAEKRQLGKLEFPGNSTLTSDRQTGGPRRLVRKVVGRA